MYWRAIAFGLLLGFGLLPAAAEGEKDFTVQALYELCKMPRNTSGDMMCLGFGTSPSSGVWRLAGTKGPAVNRTHQHASQMLPGQEAGKQSQYNILKL